MEKRGIELSFSTFIGLVLGFIVLVVFSQLLFYLTGLTQTTADEASLSMFNNLVRDINNFDKLSTNGVLKVPYFINSNLFLVPGCGKNKDKTLCLCVDNNCDSIVKGGSVKVSRFLTKVDVSIKGKPVPILIKEDLRKNLELVASYG